MKRRSLLRLGVLLPALIALAVAGMWLWVFLYHLGGDWLDNQPGRLPDATFATAAEPVCQLAVDRFVRLPRAWETPTPDERAAVVQESVGIFAEMVADLRTVSFGNAPGPVEEWLLDWETYIADRADYGQRLTTDPAARFYVTQSDRDRRQITLAIDRFAQTNGMPSCATPADLS